jgi:endoglucanase
MRIPLRATFPRLGRATALVVASIVCSTASADTWSGLKTSGQTIVDSDGRNFVPRGFGVGEWTNTEAYMLEWPDGKGKYLWYYGYTRIQSTLDTLMGQAAADRYWQTWNTNVVTESDVARWQSWGVNAVRMSINYHWLSTADGVYLDSGWQWIDQLIAWCKAHHIYVVLCLHAAPGAQSNELMSDTPDGMAHLWTQPSIYQPWTIHLWQAIAQRYANEPTVAGYDLLDEPIPPAGQKEVVRPFYIKVTDAIRSVDTNHIIFVEGLNWAGNPAGMRAMLPVFDKNMVLVFHKYWDKNDLASIQGFLDIRSEHNVPLWNGETGENGNAWAKGMATLLAQYNIGWSWWTYKKVNQSANACSIPEPPNYNQILDYVKGRGSKPSPSEAETIMLRLAENAETSNCTWNDGLVQALFGVPANP